MLSVRVLHLASESTVSGRGGVESHREILETERRGLCAGQNSALPIVGEVPKQAQRVLCVDPGLEKVSWAT